MLCIATPGYPHLATKRSKRCDTHQTEHEAAMNRFNVRLHKYRNNQGPSPGDRATVESAITYSVPINTVTAITAQDRIHIINTIAADNRAVKMLVAIAKPQFNLQGFSSGELQRIIRDYLMIRERTIDVLAEYGEEPTR